MIAPLVLIPIFAQHALAAIDRHAVVSQYNPTRNASNPATPMQVGNGNFAFGADVTGLQTFYPFAIMSSWGWKNDTLPSGKTLADIENYKGASWDNHGRPVQYDFGGDPSVELWLTSNPNRVNLGRVGLLFSSADGETLNVTESDLTGAGQVLDLWTGTITSRFSFDGTPVTVKTMCDQERDVVGISIESDLLAAQRLGLFIDFPWNDGSSSFEAPFVGYWNMTASHTTTLETVRGQAEITHVLDDATFYTSLRGSSFTIDRDSPDAHRYTVQPNSTNTTFSLSTAFGLISQIDAPSFQEVSTSSRQAWKNYWSNSGFVDVVTGSTDTRANELQRRIILSRYLMRVNEAGDMPPQESGLVNNGWYGKFHMEMYFWHEAHWALWNNWDLLDRSTGVYHSFLPSSIARAQVQQGWAAGARWPKMTDPSGRSSPGDINNLLIWQQPHPFIFAQYEYRARPTKETLTKWQKVLKETADWMASFAWWNETTNVFDLGPPMYLVSEDANPNITINPAFELAYWRLGLEYAEQWMMNLGADVPANWTLVKENLAPLPVSNGTYKIYEGLEDDFWTDFQYTYSHPTLAGLYGWLPETPGLDLDIAKATAEKVVEYWIRSYLWAWDYPMLAMSSARNGDPEQAVAWLLEPGFQFDDVGMPASGVRVATPYFPGSGALLYAIGMMACGWDGSGEEVSPGFPSDGWNVRSEGLSRAL